MKIRVTIVCLLSLTLFWAAALAKAGDAAAATPPKVSDVWVAFKTHFDIGYTDTIATCSRSIACR